MAAAGDGEGDDRWRELTLNTSTLNALEEGGRRRCYSTSTGATGYGDPGGGFKFPSVGHQSRFYLLQSPPLTIHRHWTLQGWGGANTYPNNLGTCFCVVVHLSTLAGIYSEPTPGHFYLIVHSYNTIDEMECIFLQWNFQRLAKTFILRIMFPHAFTLDDLMKFLPPTTATWCSNFLFTIWCWTVVLDLFVLHYHSEETTYTNCTKQIDPGPCSLGFSFSLMDYIKMPTKISPSFLNITVL